LATKEKSTSKAPKVDLDDDEKLREYGDQTPFLPFGEAEYDFTLNSFLYHDGYKGKAYRAKINITKVEGRETDDVKVGKEYVLHFSLDGSAEQKRAKKKELRQFLAALMKEDPRDEEFKANSVIETLTEATAEETCKDLELGGHISCRDRAQTDDDGEPVLDKKTNKPKIFTNRYYTALEDK
jgi:hypothetical protein